ncbi:HAMP domain-containing sensor histidine kinase [Vallitalea okinawensis]|uniref:HAMP domain-containing sensor histidine kinase n=1 Tax=Vallitalea okinawensis TaxID=2078660 RepID=UPI000CFD06FB|nr:ATP-binding protein [Vallitalea okinawensis]
MKRRLIFYSSILIGILVIFITMISYQKNYDVYKKQAKDDLYKQGLLVDQVLIGAVDLVELSERIDYYSTALDNRITIIDESGQVLIDSDYDPQTMDNHGDRPEVIQAYEKGYGSSIRHSSTLGVDYLYVAIRSDNPLMNYGVIRLSIPLSEIQEVGIEMLKLSAIGIIVGSILIVSILYILINQFMAPLDQLTNAAMTISKGNYRTPIIIHGDDQINKLADAFEDMRVELKKNMTKLKQRNDELVLILKSMVNGVVAVDRDFDIMFTNDAFFQLFNIEAEEDKKSLHEVIRLSQLYEVIERVIAERQPQQELINREDSSKIYKVVGNPINYKSKTIGCLLLIQDITERVKLENMRSDFVSNVTHELKTPLTSIRGFVDTLRHGALHDEKVANRFLEIIDIEAERLSTLIEDILQLSEIENRIVENRQLTDLKQVVEEILPLMIEKASKKNLQITYQLDEDLPLYFCNNYRIKQLLINLVDNAIKYTEEGHVHLRLKYLRLVDAIEISVKDTGIGIPEDQIDRIFERFYRVDKSRSRKIGGTGLGLSIVKHIVELYDGDIRVETSLNEGTNFIIKLPY